MLVNKDSSWLFFNNSLRTLNPNIGISSHYVSLRRVFGSMGYFGDLTVTSCQHNSQIKFNYCYPISLSVDLILQTNYRLP